MSPATVKTILRIVSVTGAFIGIFLLVYVGRVIAGVSDDQLNAVHSFIAFYGGYLIYVALVFHRRFSSRFVHEFISAIMCPIVFVSCVGIMESGFSTTTIRAIITVSTFLAIGVIYKILLGYCGKKLFGKEIIE